VGGWTAGKWVAPGNRARDAARHQVQIPGAYVRALGFVLLGGAAFAALVVLLALLGIRVR
jgi:hypothetical protein